MAIKKCLLLIKKDGKVKRCYLQNNGNKILYFDDTSIPKITTTIVPTPNDAIVRLYANGYSQSGNSITTYSGTSIRYTVEKNGYNPASDTIIATATPIPVELEEITYEIDVTDYNYTNTDKHLRLTEYIGSGPDVVVPNISET